MTRSGTMVLAPTMTGGTSLGTVRPSNSIVMGRVCAKAAAGSRVNSRPRQTKAEIIFLNIGKYSLLTGKLPPLNYYSPEKSLINAVQASPTSVRILPCLLSGMVPRETLHYFYLNKVLLNEMVVYVKTRLNFN
jgi:hypothetical protein